MGIPQDIAIFIFILKKNGFVESETFSFSNINIRNVVPPVLVLDYLYVLMLVLPWEMMFVGTVVYKLLCIFGLMSDLNTSIWHHYTIFFQGAKKQAIIFF